jgi:hypothetical protein
MRVGGYSFRPLHRQNGSTASDLRNPVIFQRDSVISLNKRSRANRVRAPDEFGLIAASIANGAGFDRHAFSADPSATLTHRYAGAYGLSSGAMICQRSPTMRAQYIGGKSANVFVFVKNVPLLIIVLG